MVFKTFSEPSPKSVTTHKILWDVFIFRSSQIKLSWITITRNWIYELVHKLPNDITLQILMRKASENLKIEYRNERISVYFKIWKRQDRFLAL